MNDDAAAEGPTDPAGALGRCIALDPRRFADEHWGRAPLLTRAAQLPHGFDDLFSAAAVDQLVAAHGLRTPFIRMARDGKVLAASSFTGSGGAGAGVTDQVVDDRVLAHIDEGATLVLQGLHRTWPPLIGFTAQLAAELGHSAQINSYITPPANQGFSPHYDVHDVIVLQIAGRKRWIIHEPVVRDPLEDQNWETVRTQVAERAAEPPLIDTVLEPGDSLYLPRGTIHAASALGDTSIHLTIGIHPITRRYLLQRVVDQLLEDPELRTSLPMGTDLADPDVLTPHLSATTAAMAAALGRVEVGPVADAVGERLLRDTRPEPVLPLAQLAAVDALTPDSVLRLRTGLRYRVDGTRLLLRGKSVDIPSPAALKVILAGAPFRPGELPDLDPAAALAFAATLLRNAVVVPA